MHDSLEIYQYLFLTSGTLIFRLLGSQFRVCKYYLNIDGALVVGKEAKYYEVFIIASLVRNLC
jgi:hypothetical protein